MGSQQLLTSRIVRFCQKKHSFSVQLLCSLTISEFCQKSNQQTIFCQFGKFSNDFRRPDEIKRNKTNQNDASGCKDRSNTRSKRRFLRVCNSFFTLIPAQRSPTATSAHVRDLPELTRSSRGAQIAQERPDYSTEPRHNDSGATKHLLYRSTLPYYSSI